MASQLPPAYQGVDFSQWQSWPTVVIGGHPYRQIPGSSVDQYGRPYQVYDPTDGPHGSIRDNGEILYERQKQVKKDEAKANTPGIGQQIAPVAGSTAGIVVAADLANKDGVIRGAFRSSPDKTKPVIQQQPAQNNGGLIADTQSTPQVNYPTTAEAYPSVGTAADGGTMTAPSNGGLITEPQQTVTIPSNSTQTPNGDVLNSDGSILDSKTGKVVGRWAQGAAGIYLMYQGYRGIKDGDYAGGALSAGYGAGLATSAAGGVGSETAAAYVPYAGIAYGGYNLGKMALDENAHYQSETGTNAMQGAAAGAALGAGVGTIVPVIGTGIGAGVGAVVGGLYGAALGYTGSHKGGDQRIRDAWRKEMQKAGFMDQNFQGVDSQGNVIDWNHVNGEQGSGTKNMKFDDPTVANTVAYANVLATAIGATGKARDNVAGEFAKGALINAGGDQSVAMANLQHFASQLGLDSATVHNAIDAVSARELKHSSPEEEQQYQTIKALADQMFGPGGQPAGAPSLQSFAQQQTTKSSNGQYRLSPGVYSKNKPTDAQILTRYNQTFGAQNGNAPTASPTPVQPSKQSQANFMSKYPSGDVQSGPAVAPGVQSPGGNQGWKPGNGSPITPGTKFYGKPLVIGGKNARS